MWVKVSVRERETKCVGERDRASVGVGAGADTGAGADAKPLEHPPRLRSQAALIAQARFLM